VKTGVVESVHDSRLRDADIGRRARLGQHLRALPNSSTTVDCGIGSSDTAASLVEHALHERLPAALPGGELRRAHRVDLDPDAVLDADLVGHVEERVVDGGVVGVRSDDGQNVDALSGPCSPRATDPKR
jgi:hypothetical protein